MKVLLLDYLGVALGGARTETGHIAADSPRISGKGESTIIGMAIKPRPTLHSAMPSYLKHRAG